MNPANGASAAIWLRCVDRALALIISVFLIRSCNANFSDMVRSAERSVVQTCNLIGICADKRRVVVIAFPRASTPTPELYLDEEQ